LQRGAVAHHAVIEAVRARNTGFIDRYFESARPSHEEAEQVLLSSEAMCKLGDEDLLWWRDCLERHFGSPQIAVWIFVRRISSLVPSRWHAYVRSGGLKNLPAFAFEAVEHVLSTNRFGFERTFERFAAVFGPASVSVVPMEMLTGQGELVAGAFHRMFGIDGARLSEMQHVNAALEPGSAELLRALTMRCAQEDAENVKDFAWKLIPLLRKGDNVLTDCARMFAPFIEQLTIEDRSEAFLRMERDLVDRLGDRLDGWGDGTIFGPADPAPAPYVRDEYWFNEDIRRRLEQAYSVATGLPERTRRQRNASRLHA
jgi:hypothetical protein